MAAAADSLLISQELLISKIVALAEKTDLQIVSLKEAISSLKEALVSQIVAQKEGVEIAMRAAEKAVEKAEEAANKRFDALNELRSMAADWREEFARATTVSLQFDAINGRIEELRAQLAALDGRLREITARGTGRNDIWGYIVGAAGALAAAATLLPRLVH